MRFLVTGGAGFIGSNYVRHLLATDTDAQVSIFD
jgi:dTDP-D-glucose 4,6-dehydratase